MVLTVAMEEEGLFDAMLVTYPLHRVLPPVVIQEQRYVDTAVACALSGSPSPQESSSVPAEGMSVVVSIGSSCDDSNTLRALSWGGCRPDWLRAATWRLLTDYAPLVVSIQRRELQRKRLQYIEYTKQYINASEMEAFICGDGGNSAAPLQPNRGCHRLFAYSSIVPNGSHSRDAPGTALASLVPDERAILNQIALDLPRHRAAIFHCQRTVAGLSRCLFLWSQRHPAVGYVQGMDDLLAVFYQVFLADAIGQGSQTAGSAVDLAAMSVEELNAALDRIPPAFLFQVEADTFWCAGRVLSLLQDNFTRGQPGIVWSADRLRAVLLREDVNLVGAVEESGLRLIDGCFQWLHCLLSRELPMPLLLRLWDTFLTLNGGDLLSFHVCVCAALMLDLRPRLVTTTADVMIQVLKKPYDALFPRNATGSEEVDLHRPQEWLTVIIADAYRLWRQHSSLLSS